MVSEADLFRRGKEVLGKNAGGLISRLFKAQGRSISMTLSIIEMAAKKENPREYVGRVLNPLEGTGFKEPAENQRKLGDIFV